MNFVLLLTVFTLSTQGAIVIEQSGNSGMPRDTSKGRGLPGMPGNGEISPEQIAQVAQVAGALTGIPGLPLVISNLPGILSNMPKLSRKDGLFDRQEDLCSKYGESHTMCLETKGNLCGKIATTEIYLSAEEKVKVVEEHNKYRKKLAEADGTGLPGASNMRKLTWDDDLAQVAQRWADQCNFEHDESDAKLVPSFRNVGQNIYLALSTKEKDDCPIKKGVKAWYDEIKYYTGTGENFVFGHETGHFTQIAWANSAKVGCGWAKWFDGEYYDRIIVCNYGPAGNQLGEAMFLHGSACGACPSGTSCEDSLCA